MGLPFKPNDWVADSGENIAFVKRVYTDRSPSTGQDEVLFDLVMYDRNGRRIGRTSPAMGGPRSYEPCCSIEGWRRIKEPAFPIQIQSVPDPDRPGRSIMRYHAGPTLPPANYTPRNSLPKAFRFVEDDRFRKALNEIADGHNDPRALARQVLGR